MATYNSIPRDDFHNAVIKYSVYQGLGWIRGNRRNTIQVYEIAKQDNWDIHLSVMYDPTGRNVTKIHFTLRQGPGKGKDAFAWYQIKGFNETARLSSREDAGEISLFSNPDMPPLIKEEVLKIDKYITEIFRLAISYIKTK